MKNKTPVWITLALLVVGAVAVPALAQPGGGQGRPDDAGSQGDGHGPDGNASADANRTRGPDDNRSRGPDDNRSAAADNRSRGPPAHVLERIEARCDAAENRSGHRPAACDRLGEIHDGAHQARRAAHAGLQALSAWEHLNATLAMLEQKFQDKLAQENLTENQTAAFEAKLERIDAMQENLTARIAAMEERIEGMQERWDAVREHVAERRAQGGAGGPPGFAGADDDADGVESDDADDNSTADA